MYRAARIHFNLLIMENWRKDTKLSAVEDGGFCVIKVSGSTMPAAGYPLSSFHVYLRI